MNKVNREIIVTNPYIIRYGIKNIVNHFYFYNSFSYEFTYRSIRITITNESVISHIIAVNLSIIFS